MQKNIQDLRAQTISNLQQLIPPGAIMRAPTTEELAQVFRVKAGTIRRALCTAGHYQGLIPLKLSNGRLIWPIA